MKYHFGVLKKHLLRIFLKFISCISCTINYYYKKRFSSSSNLHIKLLQTPIEYQLEFYALPGVGIWYVLCRP